MGKSLSLSLHAARRHFLARLRAVSLTDGELLAYADAMTRQSSRTGCKLVWLSAVRHSERRRTAYAVAAGR